MSRRGFQMTDICGACGAEYGVHEGDKCPEGGTRFVLLGGAVSAKGSFKGMNERARARARERARGVARNARAMVRFHATLPVAVLGALELLADTIDEVVDLSETQERT